MKLSVGFWPPPQPMIAPDLHQICIYGHYRELLLDQQLRLWQILGRDLDKPMASKSEIDYLSCRSLVM
jgi:hypothetical protein